MSKSQKLVLALSVCFVVVLGASANASAAIRFDLQQRVDGTETYPSANGLDPALQTTMRVVRGGELIRSSRPAGETYIEVYTAIQANDVVEIYQHPAADPVLPLIPLIPPVRTITVPAFTLNASAGSPVISGTAPDEWSAWVSSYGACSYRGYSTAAARTPGAFSATMPFNLTPRSQYSVAAQLANGDRYMLHGTVPGDALCLGIDAGMGSYFSSSPYEIEVYGLDPAGAPSTRVRLVRGGVLVAEANSSELDLTEAQKPLPGDVIEVYRPMGAPAPTKTVTIPPTSGAFDPGNELVAIDSQPGERVSAYVCRPVVCDENYDAQRSATNVPGGRTLLDYASPQAYGRPYDIQPGDIVVVEWVSADGSVEYEFNALQGDLTSPIGSVKLASKIKAKSITKKLKFTLTSNEAGSVSAKLTIPKSKKKTTTLASGKGTVKVGKNTLSLKTTKSGKKALKKIAKSKKGVSATLTITLTDASGNVTTIVKGTKLK